MLNGQHTQTNSGCVGAPVTSPLPNLHSVGASLSPAPPGGVRDNAVRMHGASPLIQRQLGGAFQHDFLGRGVAHDSLWGRGVVGSFLWGGQTGQD